MNLDEQKILDLVIEQEPKLVVWAPQREAHQNWTIGEQQDEDDGRTYTAVLRLSTMHDTDRKRFLSTLRIAKLYPGNVVGYDLMEFRTICTEPCPRFSRARLQQAAASALIAARAFANATQAV